MKVMCGVLLFSFFLVCSTFGAIYQGVGEAVISKNNLKLAEINAKNNALKDALTNALKNKVMSDQNSNYATVEVTPDFFRFIRSYRIFERYLTGFKVIYKVEADIIDIDVEKINYIVPKVKTSAVYYVDIKKHEDIISDNELNTIINEYLVKNNIMTNYQNDFIFAVNGINDVEKIAKLFANSKAQYLFVISIDYNITKIDKNSYCRIETLTNVYSRAKKFAPIKSIASSSNKDKRLAFIDAYKRSLQKTFSYIDKHIIKLPEGTIEPKDYTINIEGFKSIAEVYTLLNYLKDQGFINNYVMGKYSNKDVDFIITSIYNRDDLLKKLDNNSEKFNYKVNTENNKILINF